MAGANIGIIAINSNSTEDLTTLRRMLTQAQMSGSPLTCSDVTGSDNGDGTWDAHFTYAGAMMPWSEDENDPVECVMQTTSRAPYEITVSVSG